MWVTGILFIHCIHTLFRDLSRLLVIPFNLPKIGGESEEDCRNFQKLGTLKKVASSCIGWAISPGKKFEEGSISEINGVMLPMIHPQLKGLDPRFITGYSILLYFAKEVSTCSIHTDERERCKCIHVYILYGRIFSHGAKLCVFADRSATILLHLLHIVTLGFLQCV